MQVVPEAGSGSRFVQEFLPAGWYPVNALPEAVFDPPTGRLRWGPFADNTTRTLSYELVTPPSASGLHTLVGRAFFNGEEVATGGSATLLGDAPPTLSSLPAQEAFEDGPVILTFAVADDLTPEADLAVQATSSNPSLLPTANLTLVRVGEARSLTLSLVPETGGQTTVEIEVNDGTHLTIASFLLTVQTTNDPPRLAVPGPAGAVEGGSASLAGFSVADVDVEAGDRQRP